VSVEALAWVRKVRAGKAKGVLYVLADLADHAGYCFPSHRYLAYVAEVSDSSVRRLISELVARELVAIERRFNQNGSCSSNGYRLAIGDHPVKLKGYPFSAEQGACSPASTPLITGEQVTTTDPSSYPRPLPPAYADRVAARRREVTRRGGGREFCFPKNLSESQRAALEREVAGLADDSAQQVLDELAGRMASEHVRNPIRYCAALVGRLRRGEFRLELGIEIADRRAAERQRQARLCDGAAIVGKAQYESVKSLPEALRLPVERMRARSASLQSRDSSSNIQAADPAQTDHSD
jgi:hypothetical protein